jgi:cytochrome o ubiquinol oxidase subunit IV
MSEVKAEAGHGSLKSYIVGFGLSIALTLIAYVMVVKRLFSGKALVLAIMGLAVIQLYVQLYFFLHMGRESKPRWNLIVFLFMLLVLLIVVGGSLWIMYNLNYHTMSPSEIMKDEGVQL